VDTPEPWKRPPSSSSSSSSASKSSRVGWTSRPLSSLSSRRGLEDLNELSGSGGALRFVGMEGTFH
jgi:hypothetical protein